MPASPLPPLSVLEARVLGVLVEKAQTVPDTYPLTLNALTAGCNQKSSRNPVLNASESDVLEAIERLRRHLLVIESSGGRVMRYSENVKRVLDLPSPSVALLAMLALRGPQTAAELRSNCERLHRFADASSVEGFLREMAEREEGPLVVLLPRQPGEREARWAHVLGGVPAVPAVQARRGPHAEPAYATEWLSTPAGVAEGIEEQGAGRAHDASELGRRLARLEDEVSRLRATVERLLEKRGAQCEGGAGPNDSAAAEGAP